MILEQFSYFDYYRFESLHDFKEHVLPNFQKVTSRTKYALERKMQDSYSVGRQVYNLKHAFQLADTEWADGLAKADSLMEKVRDHEFDRPKTIRRVPRWSEDHGDELDIDRLRSGQEYWRTTERTYRSGPMNINIVVNNSAPALLNSDAMTWRGVAAVVLAELLEAAGYRTDIHSAFYAEEAYTDQKSYSMMLTLKQSQDRLDRSTLTNVLSGWFFRTALSASVLLRDQVYHDPNGIGMSTSITAWARRRIGDEKACVADSIVNESTAVAWIKQSLDDLFKPPVIQAPDPIRVGVVQQVATTPAKPYKPTPIKPLTAAERRQLEQYMKQLRLNRRL